LNRSENCMEEDPWQEPCRRCRICRNADGIVLTSTRSARDALSLAQRVVCLSTQTRVSKAVDENGEPLVMYTGTSSDKDFTKFKMPKNGTWFTKWPDSASDYAMDNDSRGLKYNPDTRRYDDVNSASRVMPVFLNIRNEHKLTWDEHQSVNVNNYKAAQSKLFDSLRPKGIDGIQWSPAEWVVIGSATSDQDPQSATTATSTARTRTFVSVAPLATH
jgi:hypothetical protein